jgi:hypothetical protein
MSGHYSISKGDDRFYNARDKGRKGQSINFFYGYSLQNQVIRYFAKIPTKVQIFFYSKKKYY